MQVQSKSNRFAKILAFVILWHFFFASSFVLRLNPKLFWPAMFVIAVISLVYKKQLMQGTEVYYFAFLSAGFILCLFSADTAHSAINDLYYFIYLGVAVMIARNISTKSIIKLALAFCIVHLICIYIQVFLPDLYESAILPLLPSYVYDNIITQMTYNSSYYGFTVQTSVAAMYFAIGAICAAVLIRYETKRWKKIIYVVLIALFITGVLFTTRRGSLLALCLVLLYAYFDGSRSKFSRILLLVVVAVILLLFGIEKIPGMQGMMDKMSRLTGNTMNGREETWGIALENYWNYPFFGYGVGNAEVAANGASVDNAYLAVLIERGAVGTVVWFMPIIMIFCRTVRIKRSVKDLAIDFSFYIQLLFVIMSFMENYLGQATAMFFYYLAVMSADFSILGENNYESDEFYKENSRSKSLL